MQPFATMAASACVLAALVASSFLGATGCSSDKTQDLSEGSGNGAGNDGDGGGGGAAPPGPDALVPDDGSAGAKAINTRGCGTCHNQGDSPLAGRTTKLPNYPVDVELYAPNLTPDVETGIGSWTDGQLRLAIRDGVDKDSFNLCPQMQHYRTMADEEVDAIIQYLRKIPAFKKQIPRSICPPLKRAGE